MEVSAKNLEDSETVGGKTYCYTLYVSAVDSETFRLPMTGGTGLRFLPIAFIAVGVLFNMALLVISTRKERR